MSSASRLPLLAALLLALLCPGASADELALERRIWADPSLADLRVRVATLPGGGLSVSARAASREQAERVRERLSREPGVERFQVVIDPRLSRRPTGSSASAGANPLDAAAAALRVDAGTRPHAGLLETARLDAEGSLTLPPIEDLRPGTQRRLARLLLAQPGIESLRFGPAPASPPRRSSRTERAATPPARAAPANESPAPTRTRLELDPTQPEAVGIGEQVSRPRTRIHVDLPQERASRTASELEPQPNAVGELPEASELEEANAPVEPEPGASTSPVPPAGGAETEEAATEAAPAQLAETREEPLLPQEAEAPTSPDPAEARIDLAIEELLAEAMALAGAPTTLKARVRSGVVVFGGQVMSRELALSLRELARNFDGVSRVTGGLMVTGTAERIPMDAVPD